MMGDDATLFWPYSDIVDSCPSTAGITRSSRRRVYLDVFEIERHDYPQSFAGRHKVCRQPSQHFAVQRHVEPLLGVNLQPSNLKCMYPFERPPDVEQLVDRGQDQAIRGQILDRQYVEQAVVRVGAANAQAHETAEDWRVDDREVHQAETLGPPFV